MTAAASISPASLPSGAEVVVIGGGIMGCSTAYHLAKFGCRDVVVLERKQLTCGTTWHSAAQVRQLRSSGNLTQLVSNSIALYTALEAETGQNTGWVNNGSINIATDPERMVHMRRQAALARTFDVPVEEISITEAAKLWPLMRTDDLIGAIWSPSDGRVNPSDVCAALSKGARAMGVKFIEDTPVTGFDIKNNRVNGVETGQGRIECKTVVNCAGLWGRDIALMAGADAPLYACEHFYLLTKPIDGIDGHLPTLGAHNEYLYIRDEVGGLLVGSFEPVGKPIAVEDLPRDFAFDLLNEDWDHFEPMMRGAIHRIPALETAQARMLLNGPESFTPDGHFMLGPATGLEGFFVGCGMNSIGLASGGGAGRALAEWIIGGSPAMDLWEVDVRRFQPFQNELAALRERIPEVLGLHYEIAFPDREYTTARDQRMSALHDRLQARGAYFGQRAGWERPRWFVPPGVDPASHPLTFARPGWAGYIASEHRAAREGVVVIDQSSFGKVRVRGRDAEKLLQRVCAGDMSIEPGRMVYTPMLNDLGRYESDLTIMRVSDDEFVLITGSNQAARDMEWLRLHKGDGEDAALSDVSAELAVIGVAGPKSRDVMTGASNATLSNDAFPFYTWAPLEIAGRPVRAARLSYTGELGWEIHVEMAEAGPVYDAIIEVGQAHAIRDMGHDAMNCLRVEKGFRAFGRELTADETPLEAGLGFTVKTDRGGDFIGRDAFLREKEAGQREAETARRLVHFTFDDPAAYPLGGEPVAQGGKIVGQVTSAAYGHWIGRACAMGYMEGDIKTIKDKINVGGFTIDVGGDVFAVTASLAAPYDPKGEKAKG